MRPDEVVRGELDAWSRLDADEIVSYFTSDAVWEPVPNQLVSGVGEIRKAVERYLRPTASANIEILHLAVAGNVVLTERVDHFVSGGKLFDAHVMGAFETTGDQISAWRDYFVPHGWGPISA